MLDSYFSSDDLPQNNARMAGGNILIVDDTPDNLLFLATLLSDAGYAVRKVTSGQMALSAAQTEVPNLVLLDIVMPGISGYEVCELLKANARTRDVPVIFLSALDEELDKVQAFQIGGVDYITKPFQVVEVLARIETHLKLGRLQAQLQQQNARLQQEINSRLAAESAVQRLNQGIEAKVQEQLALLLADNANLLQQKARLEVDLTAVQQQHSLNLQQQRLFAKNLQPAIAAIHTAIQRLSDREASRSLPAPLTLIETATDRLRHLMQQFLPVPLVTAKTDYHPIAIDLTPFCRNLAEQFPLADAPHRITFLPWGKAPGKLAIDPVLLQQSLYPLLDNAIRYSPGSEAVMLELFYEPARLLLRVRDQGMGIPAEEQAQIFEPFYRASNATLSPFPPGFGMGLTLAKQAIELHQGTIDLQSSLDQGTVVTLTLPLHLAAEPPQNQ